MFVNKATRVMLTMNNLIAKETHVSPHNDTLIIILQNTRVNSLTPKCLFYNDFAK